MVPGKCMCGNDEKDLILFGVGIGLDVAFVCNKIIWV